MKSILLLRHAKSAWSDPRLGDHDRPLNGRGERAAKALADIGYTDIRVLDGGAPAWAAAGFELFEGVNVPSKTFGELVEHDLQTPSITAAQASW